ncbi:MAG: FMN-binding protein [Acidimicrobiales bacterium]
MSPKRGPLVTGATLAGLAVVVIAHSVGGPVRLASPVASGPSSRTSHKGTTAKSSTGPSGASTPVATRGNVSGVATGTVEQYGYGQIAVKVSVSKGRITGATVTSLQTADSYSQSIAQQVIPMLKREVLTAQAARIAAIAGATYTSEGYAYSVQSALDKLHLK